MHENDEEPMPNPDQDAHHDDDEPSAGAGSGGDPTPRDVRVGRLDTLPAIRTELGKLYRAARRVAGPKPSPSDATKLGWLLNALATAVTNSELADRIEALEAQQKGNR
jgi:hypothetical protein